MTGRTDHTVTADVAAVDDASVNDAAVYVDMVDVAVVGAGLASLAAARTLSRAGRRVVVLEAGPEVGGRARTRRLGGVVPADLGGEWVGARHDRIQRLARDLGVRIEPAHTVGALVRTLVSAAGASRGLSPDAPWTARHAADLDHRSLADWLDGHRVSGDARYVLEVVIGALASSPPERMSLLHFSWWTRMAGGPLRTLHTTFQSRIVGGAQQLATRMPDELGGAVHLDEPVTRIEQHQTVWITTSTGRTYTARHAVVAVPPPVLDRITFDPPLPNRATIRAARVEPGLKIVATLPPGHRTPYRTVVGGSALWVAWRRGDRVTGFAPPHTAMAEPDERIGETGAERSAWPNNMEGAVRSGQDTAAELLRSAES